VLFLRALISFLILPGTFAGLISHLGRFNGSWRGAGIPYRTVPLVIGAVFCFGRADFYVSGKGTLAPWDPPKRLVIVGLYRFTRIRCMWTSLLLLTGWRPACASSLAGRLHGDSRYWISFACPCSTKNLR